MTLAGVVVEAFAAWAEDIATKQRQRLGQFGVFLLELAVIGGGRVEDTLEFIDPVLSVFELLLSVFSPRLRRSSACRRNSSLRRSRSSSNRWICSGSSGRCGMTLIT